MIHSHLVSCMTVYSCANKTTLNKLKLKQKEAIRVICNAGYRDHTAPLFKQLKILPFDEFVKFCILKFMHSFTHTLLPLSFHRMWTLNRDRYPDRLLHNANQLHIVSHNYETLKRLPLFNFPNIWNHEPDEKLNPVQHRYLKNLKKCVL
jgi:hypothetical protein